MMIVADQAMPSGVFSVPVRAPVRPSRGELERIGATRWASPPPGLSRNLVYLLQLGMLVAALLILMGERMVFG